MFSRSHIELYAHARIGHYPSHASLLADRHYFSALLASLLLAGHSASPLLSGSQVQEVHLSALLASPLLSGSQVQEVQICTQSACLICHVPLCKCMYVHMCPESKAILRP